MAVRVAILRQDPRLNQTVLDSLREEGFEAQLFDRAADLIACPQRDLAAVEVLFAPGHAIVGVPMLERLPQLTGIVSPYIGIEGFDRAAATVRGILIANGQMRESIESMAEGTILMLLAAAYQLPAATAAMADGKWPAPLARGRLVSAMTIGIVGFGAIAQAVTHRLIAFGCRIMVYAPRLRAPLPPGVDAVALEALMARSDAIILLASFGADSRHLIDADKIARVKQGAIIVNTARGGLIDETALAAAAHAGKLGWLALDVFEREPLPPDAAVRRLPRIILTPHTIGHTGETIARLPLHALDCIRHLLRGEEPPALVNPEALPAWQARQLPQRSEVK